MNKDTIAFAYELGGAQHGQPLSGDDIGKQIKAKTLAWVHFANNNDTTRSWLEQELSYLDPFIVEALLAEETRPRVTQIDDGALVILRGVNLNENADPDDMVSIRLWIDEHRIISVQMRKLRAVSDIAHQVHDNKGPVTAGDFICSLISRLSDRMEPAIGSLDDATDDIEEQILANPDTKLREAIVNIRIDAITFRRHMAPQREAIAALRNSELLWLEKVHKRQLSENFDRLTRYIEDLDAIRERAQIVKDELANLLADRLNKNMYILSIIAAIFLPLGFLTGMLGINVGGIPGADNPHSFWIFAGSLCALVAAQIIIFKKLKWF